MCRSFRVDTVSRFRSTSLVFRPFPRPTGLREGVGTPVRRRKRGEPSSTHKPIKTGPTDLTNLVPKPERLPVVCVDLHLYFLVRFLSPWFFVRRITYHSKGSERDRSRVVYPSVSYWWLLLVMKKWRGVGRVVSNHLRSSYDWCGSLFYMKRKDGSVRCHVTTGVRVSSRR